MGTLDFADICNSVGEIPNIFEMTVYPSGTAILSQQANKPSKLSHINGIPMKPASIYSVCCNLIEHGFKTLTLSEDVQNAIMESNALLSIVQIILPDGPIGIDVQGIRYENDIFALKVLCGSCTAFFRPNDVIFQINEIPIGCLSTHDAIELFNTSLHRHILVFRGVENDIKWFNREEWCSCRSKYLSHLKKTSQVPKPLSFKEPYRSVSSTQLSSNFLSVSHYNSVRYRVLSQPACGASEL